MCMPWKAETWHGGWKGGLRTGPTTLCSPTAALPGEELLCCVCRSETVVPGNRLVSCEKCRHGERAGHLNDLACPEPSRLPLKSSLHHWSSCHLSWLSPQATAPASLNSVTSLPSSTGRNSHGIPKPLGACSLTCKIRVIHPLQPDHGQG